MRDRDIFSQLEDLLTAGLSLGPARVAGPLALTPVYGGRAAPPYLIGAEAMAQGQLSIGEVSGGSVPNLVVKNTASLPVLLIDGEHLKGAMQNRVLNTSVLVAANSTTVIPVSCVEAHRWHHVSNAPMQAEDTTVHTRLRSRKAEAVVVNARAGRGFTADQGEVWEEIEQKSDELGAPNSPTAAVRDAYESRRGDLEAIVDKVPRPDEGQIGVVAHIAGHPIVADIFDKPETLRTLWQRLVAGYSLDALGHRTRTPDVFSARGFLAQLIGGDVERSVHDGVGLGQDLAVTNQDVLGHGLEWERSFVHLAVFSRVRSQDLGRRGSRRPGARIDAPRRRGTRREWFGN